MGKYVFCRLLLVGATATIVPAWLNANANAGDAIVAKKSAPTVACDSRGSAAPVATTCVRISGHVRAEMGMQRAGAGDEWFASRQSLRLAPRQSDRVGFRMQSVHMQGIAGGEPHGQSFGGARSYLRPNSDSRDVP
jgi:hypothetical protein